MQTHAILLSEPEVLSVSALTLTEQTDDDVIIQVRHSGISTGTERLLWSGRMPDFPGMGYPLVPGYETIGEVIGAGDSSDISIGQTVFVPGSQCFEGARGLFGGAASRLVVPSKRVMPVPDGLDAEGVLLALAATAYHAIDGGDLLPDLVVGHGVLGRLVARLACALGGAPVVWERDEGRRSGADGYAVCAPDDDDRADYALMLDASGDVTLLDRLIGRLAPRGEIILAGFYAERISFAFPPAFMREARLRVAAEWTPDDLAAVAAMVDSGSLSLGGLITHRAHPSDAASAYRAAFEDRDCLKMIFDWRELS
ncbi:MAG: chlorophyll synthesis pathway protein BchC [Pseudomonadota bacterium]